MSSVVNDSFIAGEIVSETDLNEKFTDVTTVTAAAMDGSNVRSEGLDRFQLVHNGASTTADIILIRAEQQANGVSHTAGTTYNATATRTNTELAGGSGSRIAFVPSQTIEAGDVLRVYWHVWTDSQTISNQPAAYRSHPCWLVWLQWDITSAALVNWTEVPNQHPFTTDYGAYGATGMDIVGDPIDETAATMVIPHMTRYDNGGGTTYISYPDWTGFRHYNYVHAGNSVTLHGLRLIIDGLFYPWSDASVGGANSFIHLEADGLSATDSIEIGPVYMIAVLQRTK